MRKPGRAGSGVEGGPPSPNPAATKWPGLAGPQDLGTGGGTFSDGQPSSRAWLRVLRPFPLEGKAWWPRTHCDYPGPGARHRQEGCSLQSRAGLECTRAFCRAAAHRYGDPLHTRCKQLRGWSFKYLAPAGRQLFQESALHPRTAPPKLPVASGLGHRRALGADRCPPGAHLHCPAENPEAKGGRLPCLQAGDFRRSSACRGRKKAPTQLRPC